MEEPPTRSESKSNSNRSDDLVIPVEPSPRKGKSRVSIAIALGASFAGLSAWAGFYGNLGQEFLVPAALLMISASIVLAWGVKLELRNHHWEKTWYNRIFYTIIAIALLFSIPIFVKSRMAEGQKSYRDLSVQLASELDDRIRKASLIFYLAETNQFDELVPLSGQMVIYPSTEPSKTLLFSFRDSSGIKTGDEGSGRRDASYFVELRMNQKIVRQFNFLQRQKQVEKISLPVPIWAVGSPPYERLRDLHNSGVSFEISSNLIRKVRRIELVVNGWAVFHKDLSAIPVLGNGARARLLSRGATPDQPPSMKFTIQLRDTILQYYTNLGGSVSSSEDTLLFIE